jgi:hypothetical protein
MPIIYMWLKAKKFINILKLKVLRIKNNLN